MGGKSLVPAICTQCGGRLDVDPDQDAAQCPFCRTPFLVEQAINNYEIQNATIENVDTVNVHRHGAVSSVVGFVERQLNQRQQRIDEDKRKAEELRRLEEERRRQMPWIRKYGLYLGAGILVIGFLIFLSVMGARSASPDDSGRLTMPGSPSSFSGENYHNVIDEIQQRGFSNVRAEPLGDLILGWLSQEDTVDKVSVAGNTDYSSSARYAPDVEIVVYYHSFPEQLAATTPPVKPSTAPSPSASPSAAPGRDVSAVAAAEARWLEILGITQPIDLVGMDGYDYHAPLHAVVPGWEGSVNDYLFIKVQQPLDDEEVLRLGINILNLVGPDFREIRGIVFTDSTGLDHNFFRHQAPGADL